MRSSPNSNAACMRFSLDQPRVRIDIPTTGGAKLWAFEQLVRSCFEHAVQRSEISAEPANTANTAGPDGRAPGP